MLSTILASIALVLIVLVLVIVCVLWRRVGRYRVTLDAVANAKQVPPTELLVQHWINERRRYPPGTPKHTAYTNRLKALGILPPDGN